MKVLCSACEAAEARVLCCADEAALCNRCDRDVHAANRLAGKHQRLPLLSPGSAAPVPLPPPPKCDICQVGARARTLVPHPCLIRLVFFSWIGNLGLIG
jgi:hypothetical protein